MNRQSISVQPVTTAEERALLTGLWLAASVESGISPEVASRRASHGAVEVALQRPDVHGFLAYLDGAPAGFLVATESVMRFGEGDELVVEQIYVDRAARRHGVARALLHTATGLAERLGFDRIASAVPASARDANRFFARLGFGPAVTRRVASVSAVRRRVAPSDLVSSRARLLHMRRSMRARGQGGGHEVAADPIR
ncbi:GNAT family N-acetyltransferase [Nostocoides sp. F2B08]|uniref:GNAT family N-acetyltransferase n=1 Tax=Nostocoides sp. F2B08 TaxID=2653936 RepID=UPI001262C1E7|nr:GNAT family N-acetyltransferase [Tetrasphaera sp. F2B08]KAB7744569.1 GNAT family N-acetyltransferase [Tetrasphaera sp. F2B08]